MSHTETTGNIRLRQNMTSLVMGLRRSTIPPTADIALAQSSISDEVQFQGELVRRKRIVLLAPKCSTATCTMCPLPNEALDDTREITSEDLIAQIDNAFPVEEAGDVEMVTIYNNGNFFSDSEMAPMVRVHIYNRVAESNARILTVESLPQFITPPKIAESKRLLNGKRLAVAIGLQSASDQVRKYAVNTTCTKKSFEAASRLLTENDYSTLAFLLIKPPFLTETEGIVDAVESIGYLSSLGINDPILCPTRVAPNTVAEMLLIEGKFRPPWLYSIADVLNRSAQEYPESLPRVVISELHPNANSDSVCASNCEKCNDEVIGALAKYNNSRDPAFLEMNCDCYEDYLREINVEEMMWKAQPLAERVSSFLK